MRPAIRPAASSSGRTSAVASEASNWATRSSRPIRRNPYTISATDTAVMVTSRCSAKYAAALAATAGFFPLMISERMSVSSRHLLIDGPHATLVAGLVSERAGPIDELGIVRHQAEQRRRRGCGDTRRLGGVLLRFARRPGDEPKPLVERQRRMAARRSLVVGKAT